jgi:predicted dehydrogenase
MEQPVRFGVIGIDHPHVFGQADCLLAAGAEFVSFHAPEDALALPFAARYPQARRVDDPAAVLEDDRIALVVTAAVPADRAAIAMAAMRHGRDVMSDKPGMTTLEDLAALRRVQEETGRIYSIMYSEHFETRCTVRAGELVAAGAIGRVIHTTGLGPHAIHNSPRPGWFFERARYGGVLADIASHQCEQFLFFSDALEGRVLSASVANRAHPDRPGLQDLGDVHLATETTTGYVRVDWFTPKGLPVWGDGRLIILGSEGYIELRKYVDVVGRPGGDHLFLVDGAGMRHVDCADTALPYGPALIADVRERGETAMPQARCFAAMELALTAQAMAEGARP